MNAPSLLEYLRNTDSILSRTIRSGTVLTSVNLRKKQALLTGNKLRDRNSSNLQLVSEYISSRRNYVPNEPLEILVTLVTLAQLTNFGILPEGMFRTWDYVTPANGNPLPSIPPSDIAAGLESLSNECCAILKIEDQAQALREVAGLEWELCVGPLHPFYDACGRISRYFAVLVSLWMDIPLPHYSSREEYFAAACEGKAKFGEYVRAQASIRIGA